MSWLGLGWNTAKDILHSTDVNPGEDKWVAQHQQQWDQAHPHEHQVNQQHQQEQQSHHHDNAGHDIGQSHDPGGGW